MCLLMLWTLWIQKVRWHHAEKHLLFCLATVMTNSKMVSEEQHLVFCLATVMTNTKMVSEEQHYWLISRKYCRLGTCVESLIIIEWGSEKRSKCHSGSKRWCINITSVIFSKLLCKFYLSICLTITDMWCIISDRDVTICFTTC